MLLNNKIKPFISSTLMVASLIAGSNLFGAALAADDISDKNLFKLGFVSLVYNDDSKDLAGDAALTPPGATVAVDTTNQLGGSYTRFINDHFGLEFFLGLPFTLDIEASGTLAGAGRVAEVDVLAPTLLANYYFTGPKANFRPYISLALNHTIFYNAKATPTLNGLLSGTTSLDVDNSTGLGAFIGFNHRVRERFFVSGLLGYVDVNADVSLVTDTVVDLGAGPVPIGPVPRKIKVDLDPTVIQLTAGFSF